MSTYEFSVPCLFGLEGIAGDELRRLDIPNVRVENGRVRGTWPRPISACAPGSGC